MEVLFSFNIVFDMGSSAAGIFLERWLLQGLRWWDEVGQKNLDFPLEMMLARKVGAEISHVRLMQTMGDLSACQNTNTLPHTDIVWRVVLYIQLIPIVTCTHTEYFSIFFIYACTDVPANILAY